MSRHCRTIDVDGIAVRAHFDREPTAADIEAIREIARAMCRMHADLPPEVLAAENWHRQTLAARAC